MSNNETRTLLAGIAGIISQAERMRGAYWFTPPANASGRRSYERYHSRPLLSWTEGGHEYTARYTVTCSCRNVYAAGEYTKDGKKTTLTAIRNSYSRMAAAAGTV